VAYKAAETIGLSDSNEAMDMIAKRILIPALILIAAFDMSAQQSVNPTIAAIKAEGLRSAEAALLTVDVLEARGQRANAKLVDRVLSRVPDVPPVAGDELPTHRPLAAVDMAPHS